MTLPRSNHLAGRPSHLPHAVPPDAWGKTEGRPTLTRAAASDASPLAGDSGRDAVSGRGANLGQGAAPGRGTKPGRGTEPGRSTDSGRPHAERISEQRRALGRRLAALRSRSGFSQWEFAPLTGYSRSTLSDAELGRHRLRREFWQRCDEALMSEGVLTAAYDRIEALATAVRRSARIQAQAVREEKASRRLQALLPASSAGGPGPAGPGGAGLGVAPDGPALGGPVLGGPVLGGPVLGGPVLGGPVLGGPVLGGPVLGGPAPAGSAAAAAASSGAGAHPDTAAQPEGEAVPSPPEVMERCPHCHQPVAVIIVAAASPAGSPDG
jgi:Helix-turn-helix domain